MVAWIGAALLGHTNAVGFQAVANPSQHSISLSLVYGTYHGNAAPQGALSLFASDGTAYTVEQCSPRRAACLCSVNQGSKPSGKGRHGT